MRRFSARSPFLQRFSASSVNVSLTSSISNRRWYCLTSAFFRLRQDLYQRLFVQIFQRRQNRQTADEFGNQAELQQIFRLDSRPALRRSDGHPGERTSAPKPIAVPLPRAIILLQAAERAAADEQDVGRIHLQEFLLRMLAATLRRHAGDRAFHDLQQRLLHAFARHVPGDRRVIGLAADLIDFVDIDDAALRPLDIIVRGLQQLRMMFSTSSPT